MTTLQPNINQNIILYLQERMGSGIESRKKVMKLMFILEYFDFDNSQVVEKVKGYPRDNKFIIYYYGVYSHWVMKDLLDLVVDKGDPYLSSDNIKKEYKQYKPSLSKEVKNRTDKLVQKFGVYGSAELEIMTLNMIGLDPTNKEQYHRRFIKDIMKEKKEKIEWENSTGW